MQYCDEKNKILLAGADVLDIVKTFECGQCFRWNADSSGVYTGVVNGSTARVWTENGSVFLCSDGDEAMWRDYFDLDTDYESIRRGFFGYGEYMRTCAEYGAGIRILRQNKWEALCSFIISQCNNIPRIKKIVETLCREFGEGIYLDGQSYYTFPSAERIAALEAEDLAPLRCGYRAPYIITAARAVAEGEIDLDALSEPATSCAEAVKTLRSLHGIGEKVANCVVLFSLRKLDAFPVDVWMKRALRENFPPDFDPKVLGSHAGIAQQYIFYYARSGGKQN